MTGSVTRIEKHVGLDGRHFVTLCFDCDGDALQHLHALLRAEAATITGCKSWQKPHLDAQGRSVYVNDVNPHITVAIYAADKGNQADAEFAAMQASNAFRVWKGMAVTLGPIEEHYG